MIVRTSILFLLCFQYIVIDLVKSQDLPPNILLIVAEDLNAYSLVESVLHAKENTLFSLPNLIRLHKRGVLFKNSYATSSNCSPSRSSLLTALYPYVYVVVVGESIVRLTLCFF
jgi:hypothetical protein